MASTSSPESCPYGAMPWRSRSSTYRVPLTTVPLGPVGVMVTSTVADAPGAITTGARLNAPVVAVVQRSPVVEVTDGSNALVMTVAVIVAVPVGAGVTYGPHGDGPAIQRPVVTLPPDGA